MTAKALVLRFGGSLVEQLGAQLYPSATATVAELISNAWDADAKNVWVTIPLGTDWTPASEIIVCDDGVGMDRAEAQDKYLIVGRKRRVELKTDLSPGGRKVHGRKGIGKLAAFGTARVLECLTQSAKGASHFCLDYDEIRKLKPTADYEVDELPDEDLVADLPQGKKKELDTGTRVKLMRLLLRRALSEDQFVRSMARRFSISATEMKVFINGKQLKRFDMPVQFRFPEAAGDRVPGDVTIAADGWAEEEVDGKLIRWWIGFTEHPLEDDALQGISILARNKMAQRPFKFERAQGTEGQLGQEYLVGEVIADWLDEGLDIEDDLIQSNRDQLRLEDARLDPLMEWGRKRLSWALRERNQLRRELNIQEYETNEELEELLGGFTRSEKARYRKIAEQVSKWPEQTPEALVDVMSDLIDAQSDWVVRQMIEDIEQLDDPIQEEMWKLVHAFGLIDARRNASIIEARLATIEALEKAVHAGLNEVPGLHNMVKRDPWLLDPRWHLYDDEVKIEKLGVEFEPEQDEKGQRLDFLYVLTPSPPAPVDEVVVVEIKRGKYNDGRVRKVTEDEVEKFVGYVLAIEDYYAKSTDRPTIQGIMVAQDYNARAERKRRHYEKVQDPRTFFKTWDRVIEETKRMHIGWLHVSKRRAAKREE